MTNNAFLENFEFRTIKENETDQAVQIELLCFPPNEACSAVHMAERIKTAPELFLVAIDQRTCRIAGFLNGLATEEQRFRDEFFTDAALHTPAGSNIMLLGLDVLPEYRRQGLAREIVARYLKMAKDQGRHEVFLTCLEEKVEMYQKFGFTDHDIADSDWGGEKWHEMSCIVDAVK